MSSPVLPSRIVLVRHGRPDVTYPPRVPARDLALAMQQYRTAGILPDPPPPPELLTLAGSCRRVVCSGLRRSAESARLLGAGIGTVCDPLYDEVELPYGPWPRLSLPAGVWVVLLRIMWLAGYSRHTETVAAARRRAARAAERLANLAVESGPLLLLGHGVFNRFLASQLRRLGWRGPAAPGAHYWGHGVYDRCATAAGRSSLTSLPGEQPGKYHKPLSKNRI